MARLGWVHGGALAVQGKSSALAVALHSIHTDELVRVLAVCPMHYSIGGVTHVRLDSQWPASHGHHDHGAKKWAVMLTYRSKWQVQSRPCSAHRLSGL